MQEHECKMIKLQPKKLFIKELLLNHLRNQDKNRDYYNVKIQCQNGELFACGLLLGAISPILRCIGRNHMDMSEITIYMPDYKVSLNLLGLLKKIQTL